MTNEKSPPHRSLYRKWRPQRFSEVVGQKESITILRNSVDKEGVGQAYLFAGPRGTGKTSVARIMAKAINCENRQGGEPCNECPSCNRINKETALDVIEIDGASNRGIDEIRELREEVNFVPAEIKYKVYIIDEVHMLTNEAFNALLKTLEEPPDRVLFIFATTEPQKIPATIVSRCQVFEFKELPPHLIKGRLETISQEENIPITSPALDKIAKKAKGSMRDGLVLLEQLVSYKTDGEISEKDLHEALGIPESEVIDHFINAMTSGQPTELLDIVGDVAERGRDLEIFLENVLEELRRLITEEKGFQLGSHQLVTMARKTLNLLAELRQSRDKQIVLEIGALELVEMFDQDNVEKDASLSESTGDETKSTSQSVEVETPSEAGESKESESTDQETIEDGSESQSDDWSRLMKRIEQERISIAAFLREAATRIEEEKLVIEFSPQFSFHKESLQEKDNLDYLQKAVKEVFGDEKEIVLQYSDSVQSDRKKSLLEKKTELVREKFNGTIVEES